MVIKGGPPSPSSATAAFFVVYDSFDGAEGTNVRGLFLNSSGQPVGPEFVINSTRAGDQSSGGFTVLKDGRIFITFNSGGADDDGSGSAVRGRLFSSTGVPQGEDFVLATTTDNYQQRPTVTLLADGRILAGWESYDGADGSGKLIRAQIFDPRGDNFQVSAGGQPHYGSMTDNVITGTEGYDVVLGLAGNDTLIGNSGNDTLAGGAGADDLAGGSGGDTFIYDAGEATTGERIDGGNSTGDVDAICLLGDNDFAGTRIYGIELLIFAGATRARFNPSDAEGYENWTIAGDNGQNEIAVGLKAAGQVNLGNWHFKSWSTGDKVTVNGSSEGDNLVAPASVGASIDGGAGHDTLIGGAGYDYLYGGSGNDVFYSQRIDDQTGYGDFIDGGDGVDIAYIDRTTSISSVTFNISVPARQVASGDGMTLINIERLSLAAGSGNDSLTGGELGDTLMGGAGRDQISGGRDSDSLDGGAGIDIIDGGAGNDTILGGTEADLIDGGSGNDFVYGDAGADNLDGGDGNDVLNGGSGYDILSGGLGNDTLFGAGGVDRLDGGEGDDLAVFSGNRADYGVSETMEGLLVTHLPTKSMQVISDVEFYQFTSGTLSRAQFVASESLFGNSRMSISADENATHGDVDHGG
jgi:Ca2+-binding RTX toxin-like protein